MACFNCKNVTVGLVYTHMPSVVGLHSLWKGVKTVGLLGVRESHSHARGERGVEDDCGTLVARGEVHRGNRANALPVDDHVLGTDAVPLNTTQLNINHPMCSTQ